MLKFRFFLSVSLPPFFFPPKIGTTTAVFTMSELMWAINTLSSLASWSWFVSELGALVLTDCRIANLYYALFLYTDFFTKTLCTLWGECHSPITGMPSATVQSENQLVKSYRTGHFLVSSVSKSSGLTSILKFPNESSPPALVSWEHWGGSFWISSFMDGDNAAWDQLGSALEQLVTLISFPSNKMLPAHTFDAGCAWCTTWEFCEP